MAEREDVDIRIRLREAAKFNRDAKKSARSIDEIGDEAGQAARKLGALSVSSSNARINIGPLSTSVRGGALAFGALALAVQRATPVVLGLAEATATVVTGAGAAGGVGLLALAQGTKVARLGLSGLEEALGGSEEAAKKLSPELFDLFLTLEDRQRRLQRTAQEGLLPGLGQGARLALRNFGVLNRIVGDTAETLGDLGTDAGTMLGSREWGRDLRTAGRTNIVILENLGAAGLDLADAARHIVVEAGPLAMWLSRMAARGATLTETWVDNKRQTGELARFFRDARRDLELLGSATGHGGRGLINLFGAGDVDGTKTLRSLDQILARFERWTESPAVRESVGDAIVAEIPDAVAAAMDAIARNLPGAASTAAGVFWDAFWDSSLEGKALMGALALSKLGAFRLLGRTLGGQFGRGAAGGIGGAASKMAPVPVIVMNPGFGAPGAPGAPGGGARAKPGARTAAGQRATRDWMRGRQPTGPAPVGKGGLLGALGMLGILATPNTGDAVAPTRPGFTTDPDEIRRRAARRQGPSTSRIDPFNMPRPFQPIINVHVGGRQIRSEVRRENARVRAREGGR